MDESDEARRQRHETKLQQLDRNWADLLQELRVTQTGVQLLTGFLLIMPFQSRFGELSAFEQTTYLLTVAVSIVATAFLIAPVNLHRLLFRRHARRATVQVGHRLALVGIVLLGVAMIGVCLLVFSMVLGEPIGAVAAGVLGVFLLVLWVIVPLRLRNNDTEPHEDPAE